MEMDRNEYDFNEPVKMTDVSMFVGMLSCSSRQDARVGCLQLFQMETRSTEDAQLKLVQDIDMPGILDMKWCAHDLNGSAAIAVADASGATQLYRLSGDSVLGLVDSVVSQGTSQSPLTLSLDWSSDKSDASGHPLIVTSNSAGTLSLIQVDTTGMQETMSWKGHDFEAWIAAFDHSNTNTVYSGGDDTKLKGWDIRQRPTMPTFTSSAHKMGVTSIHSNSTLENVLATGSYDECVLVWDSRNMKRPTQSVQTGGGVWRLKWIPDCGRHLLAACMHGGAKVIRCEKEDEDEISIEAAYLQHESMVYGIDWSRWRTSWTASTRCVTVATCSFYDKALHLWNVSL